MSKAYKGIAVLRKLQNIIPRNSLLTIYKSFIRPHLDYGDIIYHQPNNGSLCQKIESIQYQAALAITGAIHGTSLTKLYNKLGIESMKPRQWFRRFYYFFKIKSSGLPQYLNDHHYVIQHVFHLIQILKLEPNFLGIRFFHIL